MARRQFPIGEQDFANIRNRNMVYIDKTHLIYKFESGTPTALVETMQRNDYSLEHLTNEEVSSQLMSSVDSDEVSPIPLIYQSGYLTIKGYDEEFGNYLLGFPNIEVSEGFTRYLMPYYSPVKRGKENFLFPTLSRSRLTALPMLRFSRLKTSNTPNLSRIRTKPSTSLASISQQKQGELTSGR